MKPDQDVVAHYESRYDEDARLSKDGLGKLELVRTKLLLERYLPDPPARILDVGGGPGVYASWLVESGYNVDLVDIVPRHINQARDRGLKATLGDARSLPANDSEFDAVLLLGPLYHMPDPAHRQQALAEAMRVTKPGAPILAAAISRYASAIDGLDEGYWNDPDFADGVMSNLNDGTHRNPTGDPRYFTTAFFHRPEDLRHDLEASGLVEIDVLAIESIGWAAGDLGEQLADSKKRESLLALLRRLEKETSLLGASPHLLGVGHCPG